MLFSNTFYDIAKWICMVVFPAISTLISILDKAWGWGLPVEAIVTTLSAATAFLGALLGFSSAQYYKDEKADDVFDDV